MHAPLGVPERQQGESAALSTPFRVLASSPSWPLVTERKSRDTGTAISIRTMLPGSISSWAELRPSELGPSKRRSEGNSTASHATTRANNSLRRAHRRTRGLPLQVEVVPFRCHVQRREAGAEPVSEEGGEYTGRPAGAAGGVKGSSINLHLQPSARLLVRENGTTARG